MFAPMFDGSVLDLGELRERLRRQSAENDAACDLRDHADLMAFSDLARARAEVELSRRIMAVAASGAFRSDGHTTVAA